MSPSDQTELLRRCRRKELPAWDELIAAFSPEVGRFISLLNPRFTLADIETVGVSTFVEAVKRLPCFSGRNPAKTGLLHAAMRQARSHRPGGMAGASVNSLGGAPSATLDIEATVHLHLIHALDRLAGPCRDLIELRYFGNLEVEDLAPEFDISEDALRIRLRKCLETFGGVVALKTGRCFQSARVEDSESTLGERMVAALAAYAEWRSSQFPDGFNVTCTAQAQVHQALSSLPASSDREVSRRRHRLAGPEFWAKAIGATVGVLTVAAGVVLVANRGGRVPGTEADGKVKSGTAKPGPNAEDSASDKAATGMGARRELDEFLDRFATAKPSTAVAEESKVTMPATAAEQSATAVRDFFDAPKDDAKPSPFGNSSSYDTASTPEAQVLIPKTKASSELAGSDVQSVPPWVREVEGDTEANLISNGMGSVAQAAMGLKTFAYCGAVPLVERLPNSSGRQISTDEAVKSVSATPVIRPVESEIAGGATDAELKAPPTELLNEPDAFDHSDGSATAGGEVARTAADDQMDPAANQPSELDTPPAYDDAAAVAATHDESPAVTAHDVPVLEVAPGATSRSGGEQTLADSSASVVTPVTTTTSIVTPPDAPSKVIARSAVLGEAQLAATPAPSVQTSSASSSEIARAGGVQTSPEASLHKLPVQPSVAAVPAAESPPMPTESLGQRSLLAVNLNFHIHVGGAASSAADRRSQTPLLSPTPTVNALSATAAFRDSAVPTTADASPVGESTLRRGGKKITPLYSLAGRTTTTAGAAGYPPAAALMPPIEPAPTFSAPAFVPSPAAASRPAPVAPTVRSLALDSSPLPPAEVPKGAEKFIRTENERGLRRNLNSPPLPPVLKEFTLGERDGELALVDSDGSVYRIAAELDGPSASTVSSLAQTLRASGRPLRITASGLSQSTGEMVAFEGWFEPKEGFGPGTLPATGRSSRPDRLTSLEATQVRGEVRVGDRQRFPLVARNAGE